LPGYFDDQQLVSQTDDATTGHQVLEPTKAKAIGIDGRSEMSEDERREELRG